ncbi:MAG: autotransporter outer membrane beta-barrel domain-containing protein [Puniceicoccales bacterium]|jgi:hypothetical protein|nr:autotransporter outer membrane beta-barrel domain-containing protein [Puniceicoccales bacterium]
MEGKEIDKDVLTKRFSQVCLLTVVGMGFGVVDLQGDVTTKDSGVRSTLTDINSSTDTGYLETTAVDKFAVIEISGNTGNNEVSEHDFTLKGGGTVGLSFNATSATDEFIMKRNSKCIKIEGTPKLVFFDATYSTNDVKIKADETLNSFSGQLLLKTGDKKLIFSDGKINPTGAALRVVTTKTGAVQVGASGSILDSGFTVKNLILGANPGEDLKIVKYTDASGGTAGNNMDFVDIGTDGSGGNLIAFVDTEKGVLITEGGIVYGESSLKLANNTANGELNIANSLEVKAGATLTLMGVKDDGTTANDLTIRAAKDLAGAEVDEATKGRIIINGGAMVKLGSNINFTVKDKKINASFVLTGTGDSDALIAKLVADGSGGTLSMMGEMVNPAILVSDNCFGSIGGEKKLIISGDSTKNVLVQVGAKSTLKIAGEVVLNSSSATPGEKSFVVGEKANLVFTDAAKHRLEIGANDKIIFSNESEIRFATPEDSNVRGQLFLAKVDNFVGQNSTKVALSCGLLVKDMVRKAPGISVNKLTLVELGDNKASVFAERVDVSGADNFISDYVFGPTDGSGSKYGIVSTTIHTYGEAFEANEIDDTGVSGDFIDKVEEMQGNSSVSNDEVKLFGMLIADYDKDEDGFDNGDIARSISRSTVEERNRVTIALANMARQAIYGHMARETHNRELWLAGMVDMVRQNEVNGYGMHAGLWGAVIGYDAGVNDELVLGLMAGCVHATVRYNGMTLLGGNNGRQLTGFGGFYGEWESLVRDLWIKFSGLFGQVKYKEWGNRPIPDEEGDHEAEIGRFFSSHKGHWLSFNMDSVWLTGEYKDLKFGPWLALSYDYVHQRSGSEVVTMEDEPAPDQTKTAAAVQPAPAAQPATATQPAAQPDQQTPAATPAAKADEDNDEDGIVYGKSGRHMLSGVFGVHMEGELPLGKIFVEVGYKREFCRRNRIGDSQFLGLEYAPAIGHATKNLCIIRTGYGLTKNHWGLDFGLEGQLGRNFKDCSANIVATYSF